MRTLRARLLLLVGAVLVVTAAASWLLVTRITRSEADRFVHAEAGEGAGRLAPGIAADYRARGGWSGVDSTLERIARDTGRLPVLVLAEGTVHLPPSRALRDARLVPLAGGGHEITWRRTVGDRVEISAFRLIGGAAIVSGGRERAVLHLLPMPEAGVGEIAGPAPASTRFVADLTRSVAIALALAALAALGVAFALARGVVGPLEALTRAVRNLDAGELDARVDVRSADEIGALATAFNDMAARLGRTERLRRALVADVAHELRTPLTNLMAQLEAIQDGLVRADGPALASLHEELEHLARLIDDLEELAAADAGQVRLDLRSLVLGEELERTIAALVPRATRAGVMLTLVPAPGLPVRVRADARRLGQVMRNLLDNALAHTPTGGRVTVTTRVEQEGAGGHLAVTVADTGVGIADEHLARIFDRFYRVDPSRARETGGSGLGLAIVRQYVELMGGTIDVTSRPGEGTSLTFTLPRATDS